MYDFKIINTGPLEETETPLTGQNFGANCTEFRTQRCGL